MGNEAGLDPMFNPKIEGATLVLSYEVRERFIVLTN
jgi:hypothetical protein